MFYEPTQIDGLPGFITLGHDGTPQTTALALEDDKIVTIYMVRNPDKLQRLRLPKVEKTAAPTWAAAGTARR